MRKLMLAGAAALAFAVPAAAQDSPDVVEEVIVTEVVPVAAPEPAPAPAPAMRFVPSEVVQATPPSAVPADGDFPPCKGKLVDNCVNPREAGLNYGNRALDYWPGKPASEIKGPIPAVPPKN